MCIWFFVELFQNVVTLGLILVRISSKFVPILVWFWTFSVQNLLIFPLDKIRRFAWKDLYLTFFDHTWPYGTVWSHIVGEWKVELSFLEAKAMVDLSLSNRSMKVKTFSSKSPCLVEILTDSGLKMSKIRPKLEQIFKKFRLESYLM